LKVGEKAKSSKKPRPAGVSDTLLLSIHRYQGLVQILELDLGELLELVQRIFSAYSRGQQHVNGEIALQTLRLSFQALSWNALLIMKGDERACTADSLMQHITDMIKEGISLLSATDRAVRVESFKLCSDVMALVSPQSVLGEQHGLMFQCDSITQETMTRFWDKEMQELENYASESEVDEEERTDVVLDLFNTLVNMIMYGTLENPQEVVCLIFGRLSLHPRLPVYKKFLRQWVTKLQQNDDIEAAKTLFDTLKSKYDGLLPDDVDEENTEGIIELATFIAGSLISSKKGQTTTRPAAFEIVRLGIHSLFEDEIDEATLPFFMCALSPFVNYVSAAQATKLTEQLMLHSPSEGKMKTSVWAPFREFLDMLNDATKSPSHQKKRRKKEEYDDSDSMSDDEEAEGEADEDAQKSPAQTKQWQTKGKVNIQQAAKKRRSTAVAVDQAVDEDSEGGDSEGGSPDKNSRGRNVGSMPEDALPDGGFSMPGDDEHSVDSDDDRAEGQGEGSDVDDDDDDDDEDMMTQPPPSRAVRYQSQI